MGPLVLAVGLAAALAATVGDPGGARSAAHQVWAPFVLVTGLLALGLVARADGLFERGGAAMARLGHHGIGRFFAAAGLVAVVSAVLNLDTAAAFCTPVLIMGARHRGADELPYGYLAVFMANAGSLVLPGSNLTNLIVLGHARATSDAAFAAHMAAVWAAAVVVVAVVLALRFRRSLAAPVGDLPDVEISPPLPKIGGTGPLALRAVGPAAVVAAVAAMVVLSPGPAALVVLGVGALALVVRLRSGAVEGTQVRRAVNLAVVAGLFGLAVALGVAGRHWSAPAHLLAHASAWQAAAVGAGAAVVGNNLPAAALLSAHPVAQPAGLLIGLDLGPNLAVTGALSAVLWFQAMASTGTRASAARFTRLGLVVAPLSMAAALGVLALSR